MRILAAFHGYFQNPYANQGYGSPAFESRSRRVSRNEDFLEAWHQVRRGLHEVALYAQDQGVILALQTHPEITGNNDETLALIEEVNVPSLKVGVDLPLLENFDPEFVRKTVLSMKGLMVYSHTITLAKSATVGGAPYGWEEVTPGSPKDNLPWEVFLTACKDIGYDGFSPTSSVRQSSSRATSSGTRHRGRTLRRRPQLLSRHARQAGLLLGKESPLNPLHHNARGTLVPAG